MTVYHFTQHFLTTCLVFVWAGLLFAFRAGTWWVMWQQKRLQEKERLDAVEQLFEVPTSSTDALTLYNMKDWCTCGHMRVGHGNYPPSCSVLVGLPGGTKSCACTGFKKAGP